jgi:hypothetical protein
MYSMYDYLYEQREAFANKLLLLERACVTSALLSDLVSMLRLVQRLGNVNPAMSLTELTEAGITLKLIGKRLHILLSMIGCSLLDGGSSTVCLFRQCNYCSKVTQTLGKSEYLHSRDCRGTFSTRSGNPGKCFEQF